MQLEPVNLVALVGTILGISIVLIPVIGITARFALAEGAEVYLAGRRRQDFDADGRAVGDLH